MDTAANTKNKSCTKPHKRKTKLRDNVKIGDETTPLTPFESEGRRDLQSEGNNRQL